MEHSGEKSRKHKSFIGVALWLIVILAVMGAAFFWYELRPSDIRKNCEAYANSQDAYDVDESNNFYRMCLLRNGMKPESMFVGSSD